MKNLLRGFALKWLLLHYPDDEGKNNENVKKAILEFSDKIASMLEEKYDGKI